MNLLQDKTKTIHPAQRLSKRVWGGENRPTKPQSVEGTMS